MMPGGGMWGGSHPGHLEEFAKRGLHGALYAVQANSSGALTGTSIAEAQSPDEFLPRVEAAAAGWRLLERGGLFDFSHVTDLFRGFSLSDMEEHLFRNLAKFFWRLRKPTEELKKLREILSAGGFWTVDRLARIIAGYAPEHSLSCYFQFDVSVLNSDTGEIRTFSPQDFKDNPSHFARVPVASAAIHPFFRSVSVNGTSYEDARCIGEASPAIRECDTVFVLYTHPRDFILGPKKLEELQGIPLLLGKLIFNLTLFANKYEEETTQRLERSLEAKGGHLYRVYTEVPETSSPIGVGKGDISKEHEFGRAAMRSALNTIGIS